MNEGTGGELRVVFHRADWGWIDFDVMPLSAGRTMQATHLWSPFADLLRWLEAIADGCEIARWAVDGEWRSQEFVFMDAARLRITPTKPMLLLVDKDGIDPPATASMPVERSALVRAFYEGFRRYAENDHDPSHWDHDEESDWDGEAVGPMRSLAVEDFLRARGETQLGLDLRFPQRP